MTARELALTTGVLAGVTAFAMIAAFVAPKAGDLPREAPGLLVSASLSMGRMTVAFVLSLVFAIAYGMVAGIRPQTRPYLLPLLDIGQSIPIPALFPVVMVVIVQGTSSLFGTDRLGLELGCIFLIFSVQMWNLAFGVYEGVTQIPEDLRLAADAFGFSPAARFFHLYLPACIPKIIYNSIASWANGWYFLTLCEVLDSKRGYRVEGIGSYLGDAINPEFDGFRFIAGLSFVFAMVFAMEFIVWRPLTSWSRKFRYDSAPVEEDEAYVLMWWRRSRFARGIRSSSGVVGGALGSALQRVRAWLPGVETSGVRRFAPALSRAGAYGFFAGIGILTLAGIVAIVISLIRPWPPEAWSVPLALLKSTARIIASYLLTLLWTVPVALWVARRPRIDRVVTPAAEIMAAVPAVAVWPLLARLVQPTLGSDATAVLMLMTGMQWYLLFNLIEGVKRVPSDLLEAAQSLQITGWRAVKYLFLPAMAPALVTGSVTGFGGGWNALIVAERFEVGNETFACDGIGSRLVVAASDAGGSPVLLALNMLAMLLAVAVINRVIWHRLYDFAESRFRFDS